MLRLIARTAGDLASVPFTVLGLGCRAIQVTGTGVRIAGTAVETAGRAGGNTMDLYRDTVGMKAEALVLGLGSAPKRATT